jgi:hypothetical protein
MEITPKDIKKYLPSTFRKKFEVVKVERVDTKLMSQFRPNDTKYFYATLIVKWRDNKYVRDHFPYVFEMAKSDGSYYYAKPFGTEFYENVPIYDLSFIRDIKLKSIGI